MLRSLTQIIEVRPVSSTPQFSFGPAKPVGALGVIAFLLGIAHAWMASMHWTHHQFTSASFGYAAIAVLIPLSIAYAISGRPTVRDWNRTGLWFLLLSLVLLIPLMHGLQLLGVQPR
jgi:hypothetical protein